MYSVKNDEVKELTDFPAPSVGAPCPIILAGDASLWLAYYIAEKSPWFEEKWSKIWSDSDELCIEQCFAIVVVKSPQVHMFGAPSEETFDGHPLSKRGLRRFGIFEIENSSWIKELEKVDSIAQCPTTLYHTKFRHFIFGFHDSTFECVGADLSVFVRHGDDMLDELLKLSQELFDGKSIPTSLERI